MILRSKIVFWIIGFLLAGGGTTATVILTRNNEKLVPKAIVKTKLDVPLLSSDSFEVSGTQMLGVVNLKNSVNLPQKVELKYFIDTNLPNSDKFFDKNKPSNLKNGDIVYIKLFIKKAYITNYEFKSKINPIKFVVSGLPLTTINSSLLVKHSFVVSGVQGQANIIKKIGINFPSEVEARYFKGLTTNDDNDYKAILPSRIVNGDKVWIKFFIKKEYIATHKFPTNFINSITILVNNLPKIEIDSSLLVKSSFVIGGNQFKGTISKETSVTFPNEVETRFFKGLTPSSDSDYKTALPLNLVNGDKVWIKFFIKDRFKYTHNFPVSGFTNPIEFVISDLKILIDTTNLIAKSFKAIGNQGFGTIKLKDGVTLPSKIEVKYFKGIIAPSDDRLYESKLPVSLSNGDKVWIKFFIKDTFKYTHNFQVSSFENPAQFVVTNLIVNNGGNAFQDSNGNIWAMESKKPLLLLQKTSSGIPRSWISSTTSEKLLRGSKITNGENGVIFEDSSGNIWAMGYGTPLQVLRKKGSGFASSWASDNTSGLLKGSNITRGQNGVIFEDSSGNIWAMGKLTPLQVLRKEGSGFASSWTDDTSSGLLKGSKITSGSYGTIFEDSSGNIWAMAYGKPLQVLQKKGNKFASSWVSDTTKEGLLKGSNITRGQGGVIFEDSSGNIWAMGYKTPLQVLRKEGSGFASSWASDNTSGLLKGSNITRGENGVIFEDSSGNIWAMGKLTPLQVLRKEGSRFASSWTSDTSSGLLKGSRITSGSYGTIFEDSSGNIWAMGWGKPLQVLQKKGNKFASSWITSRTKEGLLKKSKIINGRGGTIFEDSSGNIFANGYKGKFQVLIKRDSGFIRFWFHF